MVHFILVHGTFVRGASWTRAGSFLQRALREQVSGDVSFSRLAWSGRNSAKDREKGAKRLSDAVATLRKTRPDIPIILVGHSHGGSLVAYYVKSSLTARDDIAGSVFLSVPFYACRPDATSIRLLPQIVTVLMLFIFPALATISVPPIWDWISGPSGDRLVGADLAALFLLSFGIGLILLALISYRLTEKVYRRVWQLVRRECASLQTCELPPGNYLFARVTGDEVARGLQFGLTLLRVVRFSWFLASQPLRIAENLTLASNRPWWLTLLDVPMRVGVVVIAEAASLFVAFGGPWIFPDRAISFVFHMVLAVWGWSDPFMVALAVAAAVIVSFLVVLVTLPILALFACIFGMLITHTLGWVSFATSIFADINIEPTPFGDVRFLHLRWEKRPGARPTFNVAPNHGRVYDDPTLANTLATWLRSEASCPNLNSSLHSNGESAEGTS
ncbi:hypothetical protein VW23_001625 [Devosia insulae DS-56]|uniref:AB hydrolase-1 domain-containing protein n=1 Tax=Devosia insulae DS-56 TaxID=1116389 RepID=A0A1E5XMC3_9HYPH|nr:alpha/beta fold hydrolase [Devosia insulae]OEO29773.1 hypothetical protein VW23_001625 [Devosia insulae DS-56]